MQIIDGASNATFSIFQATEDEFAVMFPNGREMEIADDLIGRIGEQEANEVLSGLWARPILKHDVAGIHGTLFYDADDRREFLPSSMREVDWDGRYVNDDQQRLFRAHR